MRTVHRLDQVVGGLMVYGLTGHAASELSRQIREDQFQKEYQAVVHWRPQYDAGTYIDLLGRNEKTRKTYVAKVPGKGIQQAVLHYRLLDNRQGFSLVEIRLETGSTVNTPTPHRGRLPSGPAIWPLPIRKPGRPWTFVFPRRRRSLGHSFKIHRKIIRCTACRSSQRNRGRPCGMSGGGGDQKTVWTRTI